MKETSPQDATTLRRDADGDAWQPILGLEVHCRLATRTKLFCGCASTFGSAPNTRTCAVCTGQPGALPTLNEEALVLALRAALALQAELADRSTFDRKNYFYCDLPKGYQITQLARPYCTGGGLALPSGRFVRLQRIHIEEDAGKAIHDRGEYTLLDLNRAGLPLIEAVTHADLRSAEEAVAFLQALKEIFEYAGVSDCDMEKGSLRCDVNVSVHRPGEPWGAKVECKNLNSFRHVRQAIEHEITRQIDGRRSGDAARLPVQETRGFDTTSGTTYPMRSKEDAHDYRYFPEPDLPPAVVHDALLERARAGLPELPAARRARYTRAFGLSEYDAKVLTASRDVADFFEATLAAGATAKPAANWISNEVLRALGDDELAEKDLRALRITPARLAGLLALLEKGALHASSGRTVLREMLRSGREAHALIDELGLRRIEDEGELLEWCRVAMVGQDRAIEEVRQGKEKALGALIGPVMKASGGMADPRRVRETLLRLIAEAGD